jgi:hypothetical protein
MNMCLAAINEQSAQWASTGQTPYCCAYIYVGKPVNSGGTMNYRIHANQQQVAHSDHKPGHSVARQFVSSAGVRCSPAPNTVLDGLTSSRSLFVVVSRVFLASAVYAINSSMLLAAIVADFHVSLLGMNPIEMAVMNIFSVVYFVCMMFPFALLLAWIYRFKKASPYQNRIVDMELPYHEAFELGLGAALSFHGSALIKADEQAGDILCVAPRQVDAAPQELTMRLEALSPAYTRLNIASQPVVNPIEFLLFGYTLAVDGGRNKANLDSVLAFLGSHK